MAVLAPPIHIKGSPLGCIRYIQDPPKIVASEDTMRVIHYMQSHCIEELASAGYHGTSGICELAVEQFRLAEAQYHAIHPKRKDQINEFSVVEYLETYHKKSIPPKLHIIAPANTDNMMSLDQATKTYTAKDSIDEQKEEARKVLNAYKIRVTKTENTAEHLIVSVHQTDKVTPELLQSLADEFMEHPCLKDFPALSNIHWNTDEKHIHFLVSNFAKNGSRKLSLKGKKLKELRRYLDKLCYDRGLSIIDTQEARLDPEHAKWIDAVRAEGKITVWEEKKVSASWKKTHDQASARQKAYLGAEKASAFIMEDVTDYAHNDLFFGDGHYLMATRRPMPQHELTKYLDQKKRKEQEMREAEQRKLEKKKREQYKKHKETQQQRAYYYVNLYTYDCERHRWQQRSLLESLFLLAIVIITHDASFIEDNYPHKYDHYTFIAKPHYQTQRNLDAIRITRELNVRTPTELQQRIAEIGSALGDKKRAVAYDQATIANGQDLYDAIHVWQTESDEDSRKAAYAVMTSNKTTKEEDIAKFLLRYNRAQARLPANQEDLQQLSKQYREAKKAHETLILLNISCQHSNELAHEAALQKPQLGDMIINASQRTIQSNKNKNPMDYSR